MNRVAKFLFVSVLALAGGSLFAGSAENDIAERLKKVGEVCVEGQDCASAAATAPMDVATAGFDVEGTYGRTCATCHAVGVAGAPKLGDLAAWEPRLAQGMETLYDHGINGLAPGMPAKGMCFTCTDQEIKELVDYMVSSVE